MGGGREFWNGTAARADHGSRPAQLGFVAGDAGRRDGKALLENRRGIGVRHGFAAGDAVLAGPWGATFSMRPVTGRVRKMGC